MVDVAKLPYMGYGATVAWIHMAQVAADAGGAALWFINPSRWAFGGCLPECALDRFLQIPVADPESLADLRSVFFEPADLSNLRRWGYFDELDGDHCAFGYHGSQPDLEEYRRSILARHYAPTPHADAALGDRLGFLPPRYVAWHVRRGDKVRGPNREDDSVALDEYVRATAGLLRTLATPPRQLVICTDSPDVLEEATRSEPLRRLELEVIFDPTEKRWDGYCDLQRSGDIVRSETMVEEILTAQKIVEILRGAELLVGCNSSYLFRVASMLSSSRFASLSENKVYGRYFPI